MSTIVKKQDYLIRIVNSTIVEILVEIEIVLLLIVINNYWNIINFNITNLEKYKIILGIL